MTTRLFYLTLTLLLIFGGCASMSQVEKKSITLYYREIGCNNDYCTYGDNLKIKNYKNGQLTYNQLVEIAMRYMDTVKSDLPISGVRFYGESPNTILPPGLFKYYWQHKKFSVLSLDFNNGLPNKQDTGLVKLKIATATLWKNGGIFLEAPHDSLVLINPILNNEE
jgi:hypothetical protein